MKQEVKQQMKQQMKRAKRHDGPLVTAIMPTRGRSLWAAQAVQCFLAQDYPNCDLLILDDADDPSFPHGISHPRVIRAILDERLTIPAKRNLAGELAKGADLIASWDSDDICAPSRLSTQVDTLLASHKAVTGYHSMIFIDELHQRAGRYRGAPNYALGTSLLYTRDFWSAHRFNEAEFLRGIAEDFEFVCHAWSLNQLISIDAGDMIVARAHADNTHEKLMDHFEPLDWSALSPVLLRLMDTATVMGAC